MFVGFINSIERHEIIIWNIFIWKLLDEFANRN